MEKYVQLKPTFETCSDAERIPLRTKYQILLQNIIVVVFNNYIVCFVYLSFWQNGGSLNNLPTVLVCILLLPSGS